MEEVGRVHALSLAWSFGFNVNLPNSVINLSSNDRKSVFYVSSNTGILLDLSSGVQQLLQGHCNAISATCASQDGRLVVTADKGPDSMVVVWDSLNGNPLATLIEPFPYGISAMDITPDAAFLITLSHVENEGEKQVLAVWDWASGSTEPVASCVVEETGYQHYVRFNPADVRDIVTNGEQNVIFWVWTTNTLRAFPPNRKSLAKLNRSLEAFTCSTFLPYSSRVITCTKGGDIILFDYSSSDPQSADASARDALKVIRLVMRGGLNVACCTGQFLVIGGSDGAVRVYDLQFRVVSWLENLDAGEIVSISFENRPSLSTPAPIEFLSAPDVPNFVVATGSGKVLRLSSSVLDGTPSSEKGDLIVRGFDSDVDAIDCHPHLPQCAFGLRRGCVQIWNYEHRKLLAEYKLPMPNVPIVSTDKSKNASNLEKKKMKEAEEAQIASEKAALIAMTINTLKFSPNGSLIAIGFQNGSMRILSLQSPHQSSTSVLSRRASAAPIGQTSSESVINLVEIALFKHSSAAITELCFSEDGRSIATSDEDRCIALYRFQNRDDDLSKPIEWTYVGKNRSHSDKVTGIYFGALNAEEDPHFQYTLQGLQEQYDAMSHHHARAFLHGRNASSISNKSENLEKEKIQQNIDPRFNVAGTTRIPLLLSVGEDRMLHRYDVYTATIHSGLKIIMSHQVEQSAFPLSVSLYSSLSPQGNPILLISTSEYKFKHFAYLPCETVQNQINVHASNDNVALPPPTTIVPPVLRCIQTSLTPTNGGPANHVQLISSENKKYLAYSAPDKVIGLICLPLDGNPNNSMNVIAHPSSISCIRVSFDGSTLLSSGGSDRSVHLWQVYPAALTASSLLLEEKDGYAELLEGGKEGDFYSEAVNYFYYCQIRAQGEVSCAPRNLEHVIRMEDVVPIMRALGYYPTMSQISELYQEMETYLEDINRIPFDTFLRLFVNHRPVNSIGQNEITQAFEYLGKALGVTDSEIPREALIVRLLTKGDKFKEKELATCFQALLGQGVSEKIPATFNPENFSFNVLGFEESDS